MARPQKLTVDYFPHICKAGKTIVILENRFGNDGYAFWFKLLEVLATTDGHCFLAENPTNWEFLLAKTHVTNNTAREIIDLLVLLEAIDKELWINNSAIWCGNLIENIADVYRNRTTPLPRKPSLNGSKLELDIVSSVENPQPSDVFTTTNTQSKVKETKLKETKLKEETTKTTEIEFNNYCDELRQEYPSLDFDNELKKFRLYWSEGTRKLKRPKLAVKNWMDKALEFSKEKNNGAGKFGSKKNNSRTIPKPEDYPDPKDW